jgi:hypothetical protein
MEQLYDYRTRLLERLETITADVSKAVEGIPLHQRQGGSPVHRALARLRNMEKLVYSTRLQKILNEEMPYIEMFEIADWEQAHYQQNESLENMLAEFSALRQQQLQRLRQLTAEQWVRHGRHSIFGVRTMLWWAERTLEHTTRQLNEIRSAL